MREVFRPTLPARVEEWGERAVERVKPAGDKANPRFEAARVKAEKEAELRAKTQSTETADEAETEAPGDEPTSSGFSFNTTVDPDEAGQ